jgi:hypothetical protein
MKTQKEFLRHIGAAVGITLGSQSTASLSDMISEDKLAWYGASSAGEVSAAGEPNLAYYAPKQYEDLYYGYVLKAKELLQKRQRRCRDKETALHYSLMLHMLEKAM